MSALESLELLFPAVITTETCLKAYVSVFSAFCPPLAHSRPHYIWWSMQLSRGWWRESWICEEFHCQSICMTVGKLMAGRGWSAFT